MAAGCYSCRTISKKADDPVGTCLGCGVFACELDGERDLSNQDFICGMCDSTRLSISSKLAQPPEEPPGRPEDGPGGGVVSAGVPTSPTSGGGAGAAIATYGSPEDFEGRRPMIASSSKAHRELYRQEIDRIVNQLEGLRAFGVAQRVSSDSRAAGLAEFDPRGVRRAAQELGAQIHADNTRGVLSPVLLADALGVAAWAINAKVGGQPAIGKIRHLPDPDLRLIVGLYTPLTAVA